MTDKNKSGRIYTGGTGSVPFINIQMKDITWEHILTIVKSAGIRKQYPTLRSDLDDVLRTYHAAAEVHARTTPSEVRSNLNRALDAAAKLRDRLHELDGKS